MLSAAATAGWFSTASCPLLQPDMPEVCHASGLVAKSWGLLFLSRVTRQIQDGVQLSDTVRWEEQSHLATKDLLAVSQGSSPWLAPGYAAG